MSFFNESMEFQDAQKFALRSIAEIKTSFQKVPGSAMLIRYIQSSYQDDPVRSAIELVLVIFFVRYLLSPSYKTNDGNFVKLTEEVCEILWGEKGKAMVVRWISVQWALTEGIGD